MSSKLYIEFQKLFEDSPYKKGGKTGGNSRKKDLAERVSKLPQTKKARQLNGKKQGDLNKENGTCQKWWSAGGKVMGPRAVDPEAGWLNDEADKTIQVRFYPFLARLLYQMT